MDPYPYTPGPPKDRGEGVSINALVTGGWEPAGRCMLTARRLRMLIQRSSSICKGIRSLIRCWLEPRVAGEQTAGCGVCSTDCVASHPQVRRHQISLIWPKHAKTTVIMGTPGNWFTHLDVHTSPKGWLSMAIFRWCSGAPERQRAAASDIPRPLLNRPEWEDQSVKRHN